MLIVKALKMGILFVQIFKKGSGSNDTLKACVSIKGDNTVITYGGDLMEGSYICQSSEYHSANTPKWANCLV